jgi:hypothetical protein
MQAVQQGDDDNDDTEVKMVEQLLQFEWECKGTSVHSLTSPVSHHVYMYSPQSLHISDHT